MTTQEKRKIVLLLMVALIAFGAFSGFAPTEGTSETIEISTSLETSDVLEDLAQSGVDGIGFDVSNYPADENGEIRIIYAVEFGYTQIEALQQHYGIFVYIYNPTGVSIMPADTVNNLTMDVDGSGYSEYELRFISRSADNIFYKFKIIDNSDTVGERILDKVNPEMRTYAFGEFEYIAEGDFAFSSAALGMSFSYTGYSAALGDGNNDSTLQCSFKQVRTISLEVKHANYKAGFSGNEVMGYQTDINSVYFSIENEVLEKYGDLVGLKATWYQYTTPKMPVIRDRELYDELRRFSGAVVSSESMQSANDVNFVPLYYELKDDLGYDDVPLADIFSRFWFYLRASAVPTPGGEYVLAPLVFYSGSAVVADELLDAITAYDKTYLNGEVTVNGKTYSADVLLSDIWPNAILGKVDFESGEVVKEVSVDDLDDVSLIYLEITDNWLFEAFYGTDQGEAIKDIVPIEELTEDKLLSATAADDVLIDQNQIEDVLADVRSAASKDETTYIYRFAYSPYFTVEYPSNIFETNPGGYCAMQGVFLDFDIIHLTFDKEGVVTILPVAMDPVDVASDIEEPPASSYDDWEDLGDSIGAIGDSIKDAFNDVGNWFKGVGEWFKDNWKWIVIGVAGVIGLVILGLIVKLIVGMRGNKVKIKVDPSPSKSPSRGSSKRK